MSASSAGEDLSRYQRSRAKAARSRCKRTSERLATKTAAASSECSVSTARHGYHTRLNPLSGSQLRNVGHVGKRSGPVKKRVSKLVQRKGARRPSKRELEIREARNAAWREKTARMKEQLLVDNPLDDISWDMKERLAVYFVLKQAYVTQPGSIAKYLAGSEVAALMGLSPGSVAAWIREYEINMELSQSKRGRHSKTFSPMYDEAFADFRRKLKAYVKSESLGKQGTPNLTVKTVAQWVNTELGLEGDDCYSERSVGRWLHYLDFKIFTLKKTLYVDGHERSDVVADRQRFAHALDEVYPSLLTIDDEILDVKPNPDATHILVSQDEKIHHSNDVQRRYWSDGSFVALPTKSMGRTVMTSDFLSEIYGFIKYSDDDEDVPGERAGSVLDVSSDGYYNSDRCLVDFQECSEAIKSLSNGRYHCVFMTDRSPIHCKYPGDGLNVRMMNVKPGGQQPKMRDGWFMKKGKRVTQSMVFPEDHPTHPGEAKGLRQVALERFGNNAVRGKRHGDLVSLLGECEDFKSQKTLLEEEATARGDVVIFGVKFHPELAPIEAAYRSIAKHLRLLNRAGSSAGFVERVEAASQVADLDITLIRKYFRSSREYLRHYVEGKSLEEIERLRKEKRKHRGASPVLLEGENRSQTGKYSRQRLR
ncbi:hypothetical protein Pmar_PMAR010971 [Perkinsus marinus ATCC 50983]|uniref:Uncharacterized protein n=1 Tax=Perkinsus marinus (strain ATCC 50983 / TXsc) TaxID=423536 RepID=C5LUH5_PERM5|nr:hypothetical protein Pmar_PMAR010971 [Perkinsus marinus ATCC 50983]EEQ99708.1 hypothetical protein Pmar_PMAR010971 [Perkinsus marinus ATCC 50983]|eukprot:XP_002766991.1 hypothetical protein Pmar_PMAR010971 [Perkinsus marinus ATCC 50983]